MSIMGGIGMLSAGLLGGPGLGYGKDRFAAAALQESAPAVYEQVKNTDTPAKFLMFKEVDAIDGTKLEEATTAENPTADQTAIAEASQAGDRATLKADSFIPATMAVIYLLIMLYFKSIGGYKTVSIDETAEEHEREALAEASATTAES